MKASTLRRRSLRHYWRTNLAVVFGVAIAVAVLAGALMVGVSVRASLRDLVLQRLGRTDHVVLAQSFFREELATAFAEAVPLVVVEGFVSAQESGRRASRVQVYAVDDRFWRFHGLTGVNAPERNDALLSEALAAELEADAGDSVVLRVESSSSIPAESLHGRKEDAGRAVRLTVRETLAPDNLGEFSLSPRQGSIRAVFVPLTRMQALIDQPARANAILIAGGDAAAAERALNEAARVDDFGLRVRAFEDRGVLGVESRSTILSDTFAAAATDAAERSGFVVIPTLTYLANSIRSGDREVPYSTITAIDTGIVGWSTPNDTRESGAIYLNEWAAKDLQVGEGDPITVEYYVWETEGKLTTRTADFRVARTMPIAGPAADRDLVPEYPGITDSDRVADWDPPFPIDLKRVRPIDEEYWNRYRATPKAFIPIERGQQLWGSRHGALTALRLLPPRGAPLQQARDAYESALRDELAPLEMGFSVYDVRAQSLEASTGATDFGEYFAYFSAFLVVSALMLAALFFKLGVEQRLQEIGLLQAVGLDPAAIRRLFVGEAVMLATAGGIFGVVGAIAHSALVMLGLRTWWFDAVGTTALRLHVDPMSLAAGALAVVLIAVASIWWSLRALAALSPRSLLVGEKKGVRPLFSAKETEHTKKRGLTLFFALASGAGAIALLIGTAANVVPRVAGFFGAGALALVAMLSLAAVWLRAGRWGTLHGHGLWAVWRLGWRNSAYRPARSVLCIALIAFATFVIVAVEAFKRDDVEALVDRHTGGGGYPLLAETLLPIVHDLNDPAGREAMNLPDGDLQSVRFDRFRLRPGDDTSCLNLYQPKNPRILAATQEFINAGRFSFHSSLAESPDERANPWLLLNRELDGGAIPVIADANSMTYVLHMKLGDEIVLPGSSERPIRLRLVGALADSIFQGELLMAERPFVRAFSEWEGYRFFLADAPLGQTGELTELLESRLTDFGIDVASTAERLAGFHRVEYTYLSTFQMLGGLGLVLGTLGLGAILLRNVLERRRELALLRALGYRQRDFFAMVVAENVLLLVGGLVVGTSCALLAIAPMFLDRGGRLPADTLALLLLAVLGTGLLASLGATVVALRSPLLSALRME